jgi:glycerol kinase
MNRSGDILLAIDQGTSSTRAIAFSPAGDVETVEQRTFVGLGCGMYRSVQELAALSRSEKRFEPALQAADRDLQIAGWRTALRRVRSN